MKQKEKLAQLGQSYNFPQETKERNEIRVTFPAYTIMQISDPVKVKSEDWNETANKFIFTIKGKIFEYYTGIAHRQGVGFDKKEYERLKHANINDHGLKCLVKSSRATLPCIEDLFYSLVMDSSAAETTFSDWCDEFGYETDSRKALQTYEACQENAVKMRGLIDANMNTLREYFQDY